MVNNCQMQNEANRKIPSSMNSRTFPGVTTGALPERLGSFGTLNTPQINIVKNAIEMPM